MPEIKLPNRRQVYPMSKKKYMGLLAIVLPVIHRSWCKPRVCNMNIGKASHPASETCANAGQCVYA